MMIILLVASVLVLVVLLLAVILQFLWLDPETMKSEAFECGFDPISKMRSPFSLKFFLLVVVFIVFDVEIALLIPTLSSTFSGIPLIAASIFNAFVLILLVGLAFEVNEGALQWSRYSS